jgi:hypothetical protein
LSIADLQPLNESERKQLETVSIWHLGPDAPSEPNQTVSDVIADLIASLRELAGEPVAV